MLDSPIKPCFGVLAQMPRAPYTYHLMNSMRAQAHEAIFATKAQATVWMAHEYPLVAFLLVRLDENHAPLDLVTPYSSSHGGMLVGLNSQFNRKEKHGHRTNSAELGGITDAICSTDRKPTQVDPAQLTFSLEDVPSAAAGSIPDVAEEAVSELPDLRRPGCGEDTHG